MRLPRMAPALGKGPAEPDRYAKHHKGEGNEPQAQLPADHFGVRVVPLVVADGPPLAGMVQLHAALVHAAPAGEAQDRGRGAWAAGQENKQPRFTQRRSQVSAISLPFSITT